MTITSLSKPVRRIAVVGTGVIGEGRKKGDGREKGDGTNIDTELYPAPTGSPFSATIAS
jgi:hypothetical protein